MRNRRQLFFIGHIVLVTLMLSGLLGLGVAAHASTNIPQDAIIASISTIEACSADDGVAYAGGLASWHQQHATLFAKYPKAKSALPCLLWTPSMALPTATLRSRADVPLRVSADTACYATHPRPPTTLTA
ncbi:MAG: hypothetical protein BWY76_01760 [bacterium ADurb.Bin429]|nr:MAG: hypothetical protein BWY76_01760 [bacterium ADurb.Bin429]